MSERVVVERLRLRVTGLAPEAAARLGEDVARELGRRLASDGAQSHGAVRVRVGSDPARIAAVVARSLR